MSISRRLALTPSPPLGCPVHRPAPARRPAESAPPPTVAPAHAEPDARSRRRLAELPGPRRLPWLGNSLELSPEHLHATLEGWSRRHGPMCVYYLGRQPVLLVSDPALAKALHKARTGSVRRMSRLDSVFEEIVGRGLFTAEGDEWRRQRQLWMQSLSPRHVRRFLPTIEEIVERLRRHWLASAGRPLDVRRDLVNFTLDVTATLAFGFPVNTLAGRDGELGLSLIFPAIARRMLSPVPYWRWLSTRRDRALDRAMKRLRGRLKHTIESVKVRPGPEGAETFLEALIHARTEDGQPYSDEVLIANAVTMLLGGQDTAASSLAWALHVLADQPQLVEAVRRETERAAGSPAAAATDGSHFPMTLALANEVLRTWPVVAWFSLEAAEDLVVGDTFVPKGTPIHISTRATLERSSADGCPLQFDPGRYLEPAREREARKHDLAFGSGPRACPGRSLALLEMRLVLSMLCQSFDIARVGDRAAVRELNQLTMIPDGLRVRLTPREGARRSS